MAITHYFVDEAGDTTLFGKFGKELTNTEGVSRFFMVARLEVDDIAGLESEIADLRAQLMADPFLKEVPSMQPERGKTALYFHAKDDMPEVRREVFRLLLRHEMRISVAVKEKKILFDEVRAQQARDPAFRYKPDGHAVYDNLIAKLFNRVGDFGKERHVTFAVRGNKQRTAVLKSVLDHIDAGFVDDFGFSPHGQTTVHSGVPSKHAGLQACDYLLWALQRFYERGEDRYLQPMWPKFQRVLDLDAPAPKTKGKPKPGGVEFNEKYPLTLQSRAGIWE